MVVSCYLQYQHQNSLRPTLGHPNEESVLAELCAVEEKRNQEHLDSVLKQSELLKAMTTYSTKRKTALLFDLP